MVGRQIDGLTVATYRSYLVRLWRSSPDSPLRASAQCVQTGAITHFADLSSLFAFFESLDALPAAAEQTQPQ
jgi:hypothetical protein